MKKTFVSLVLALALSGLSLLCAQDNKAAAKSQPMPGVLSAQELKQLMPATVFFRGQTAPIQLRNSGGVRTHEGRLVLIGLVDSSGYSSGVAQKYQAYLITEAALNIAGKTLPLGAYGVGFVEGDSFNVMDIGGYDVLSATGHTDATLRRAVPLKIVANTGANTVNGSFRLYFGKRYVDFSAQ